MMIREHAANEFKKLEEGDPENTWIWMQICKVSMEELMKAIKELGLLSFDHHWPESFYSRQNYLGMWIWVLFHPIKAWQCKRWTESLGVKGLGKLYSSINIKSLEEEKELQKIKDRGRCLCPECWERAKVASGNIKCECGFHCKLNDLPDYLNSKEL